MNKYLVLGITGLAGIAGAAMLLMGTGQAEQVIKEYTYNVTADLSGCKQWQYIEQNPYSFTLYNGDSIKINQTTTGGPLDVVEHRFYHICNRVQDIAVGKWYAYVNGKPAAPTVGIVNSPVPLYFAAPRCPAWGVIETAVWDTDDTRMSGFVDYRYVYEGDVPISIKTIELYVTRGG